MHSTGKEKIYNLLFKGNGIMNLENYDYSMEKLLEQMFKKWKLAK